MGNFQTKYHEVGTCIEQMEPYTPWSKATKGTIHKLNCGAGRKMAKSSCPTKLWDHCLEHEANIHSCTTLNNYELQGQVLETIMSRQTTDISPFIEILYYAWVKSYDNLTKYPEP